MPKLRAGYSGKYNLGKHEFYVAYHYALQYPDWIREKAAIEHGSLQAVKYDREKVQAFQNADPTFQTAEKALRLDYKIKSVEAAAVEADPQLAPWIIKGVTMEGMTFFMLEQDGIPCGRNMYYDRRRRFYTILSKKIMK